MLTAFVATIAGSTGTVPDTPVVLLSLPPPEHPTATRATASKAGRMALRSGLPAWIT
ncbi:MAG: hypothetical protein ACRDGU_03870 [Actinomycetota bacterium]